MRNAVRLCCGVRFLGPLTLLRLKMPPKHYHLFSASPRRRLWRPQPVCRLRVHTDLEVNTVVVRLTPGFDDSAILAMIEHAPKLKGLVLSLYGESDHIYPLTHPGEG